MGIVWKKVSEHPLPEGDQKTWYNVKYNNDTFDIAMFPKNCRRKDYSCNDLLITHWAEINPPEPDKEPEIALWSVWQDQYKKPTP